MRLIDADAFLEKFNHLDMVKAALKTAFDTMPTIDPVRHGKWNVTDKGTKCSVCGGRTFQGLTLYCAYCGARLEV